MKSRRKLFGASIVISAVLCISPVTAAEPQGGVESPKPKTAQWPFRVALVTDASAIVLPGSFSRTLYGGGLFAGIIGWRFLLGAGVDFLARTRTPPEPAVPGGEDFITPTLRLEAQFAFFRTKDARVELYLLGGGDFLKRDPYVAVSDGHGANVLIGAHGGLGMRYWFNHWAGIHFNTGFLGLESSKYDLSRRSSTLRTGVNMYGRISFIFAKGW